MEAADTLCKSLFCWLENREEGADTLSELKQKLEDVPQHSNIASVFGAVATISAVAFISVFTDLARLAWPILFGTASIVSSTAVRPPVSSSTVDKAIELMKEDEKFGKRIQEQLRGLKDECRGALKDRCGGAPNADELDCEMVTQLMWALAKRTDTPVPLDFLRGFNKATFFRHMTPGGLNPAKASDFICQALGLDRSPEITSSLKVSAKEMMENIGRIGTKAAKEGSGGAADLGISLYDLIASLENINQDTETGKFLQDSARQILEGRQKLKEQLDAMQEIIQKLFRMKNLIKNLGEYSLCMTEEERNIINYFIGTYKYDTDGTVLSWLQTDRNKLVFMNLLRLFLESVNYFLQPLSRPSGGHLDIVFVAHGSIDDQFMPSGFLVPKPNITDTVLYSPWNCGIDAKAAYAIAQGFIQVENRVFRHMAYYEPNPLPRRWNNMRASRHNIPLILLSPLTPEQEAWKHFYQLWQNRNIEIYDRVIIPYAVPEYCVNAFGKIPLDMFIFATSFILACYGKTATVHLAACLSRRSGSPLRPEEWLRQYAYTIDGAYMTVNMDDRNMNSVLYRAFRSMFDTNP